MDALATTLGDISSVIWGPFVLIPLLLGTGLYLTIRLGGLQFIKLAASLRLGLLKRKDPGAEGDISQFQALTTALAATVGTGNIVGVATAIGIGGPGALFWMWVTGLLGMASKYSEAFLGVRYRGTDTAGEKSGGPQYYLERGIKGPLGKFLALFFAIAATLACFGIGNMTQGNSIAANMENSFNVAPWVTGLVLTVLAMAVLVGGIKSIGKVTAGFVPVMIIFYVAAALYILIANVAEIPAAFAQIFTDAFTGTSAVGGFAGSAIIIAVQFGVARADLHRHHHRGDLHRPGDHHHLRLEPDRSGNRRAALRCPDDRSGIHLRPAGPVGPLDRHPRIGDVRLLHHLGLVVLR